MAETCCRNGTGAHGNSCLGTGRVVCKEEFALEETLLDTRARLYQRRAAQEEVRRSVTIGPWYWATVDDWRKADPAAVSLTGAQPGANTNQGRPRWTKCPNDGSGNPALDGAADFAIATILAERPVTVSLEFSRLEGFGGFAYRPPPSNAGVRR